MQHIKRNNKLNNYYDEKFIGQYIYVKKTNSRMNIHHIFKVTNLKCSSPVIYSVEKHYYFTIPNFKDGKCFCYDGTDVFEFDYYDELNIMDHEEYLDTFREFIKNDGKSITEIPSKIIQDKIN